MSKTPNPGRPSFGLPTPLGIGALHHVGYKKDPLTDNWVKGVQPESHKIDDKEVGDEHDDVPQPEPALTLSTSSAPPQAPAFSVDTLAILDAIGSLREDFRGLNIRVSRVEDNMGSSLSSLEDQLAYLMVNFPPPIPPP
ncbi:hypothetical protein J1N35_004665 [Gossypium stocksii]|uniref:Uncharacterized protein n=1 Tax=Gossypium stocksii TaxID=47602 RepID=A0A9D4AIH1_9ROSI|nr:hypothetical protein J1N35_004665 [Gossypium stocksii]